MSFLIFMLLSVETLQQAHLWQNMQKITILKYGKLEIVEGDLYISKLNLKRVDLIKIDVEGFEKYVLLGLKDTLEKYRPFVVMEYSKVTRDNLTIKN